MNCEPSFQILKTQNNDGQSSHHNVRRVPKIGLLTCYKMTILVLILLAPNTTAHGYQTRAT